MREIGEKAAPSYSNADHKKIWFEILPQTMDRLSEDPSPQNMAEASALYNMFLEGVQAETLYYIMYEEVKRQNILPGLINGIVKIRQDESRYISFGTKLLQRLIREDPKYFIIITSYINLYKCIFKCFKWDLHSFCRFFRNFIYNFLIKQLLVLHPDAAYKIWGQE